jgi:hypothetical protein
VDSQLDGHGCFARFVDTIRIALLPFSHDAGLNRC